MLNLPGATPVYRAQPYRPPIVPTFANGGIIHKKKGGILKKIARAVNPVQRVVAPFLNPKQAYKDIRKHGPLIGSILGTAIGGPGLGSTIGGGLGGAISSRKDGSGRTNTVSNALRGAGLGAMIGTGANVLTNGIPSMGQTGIGSIFSGGNAANPNAIPGAEDANNKGIFGKIGGTLGGLSKTLGLSPAQMVLAGLTGYGMLKGKNKKQQREGEEALPASMRRRPELQRQPVTFETPYYIPPPEGYRPDMEGPEHNYIGYGEPEFAAGGFVHGMSPGQRDDVHMQLPEGAFVVDASTLSDIGDGNSLAGDRTLDQFLERAARRPQKRKSYSRGGRTIPARVSSGEKIIPKEYVDAVGKGNNNKGANKLQKMVNEVRKMKRGSTKLPRKMSTKPLAALMGR